MLVRSAQTLASLVGLALLAASCSLTTDLSGLQQGAGGAATTSTSDTSATSTTTTSASGGPVCGDGIIQAGEECDEGKTSSGGACLGCVVQCEGKDEFKDPKTFHCYYYDGYESGDFADATDFCADWRKNGTLAAVTSADELFFLTVTNGIEHGTWLGATDLVTPNKHQWVTGEPWSYTNWDVGQPDSAGGSNNCVRIGFSSLKWESFPCNVDANYLCESAPVGTPAP